MSKRQQILHLYSDIAIVIFSIAVAVLLGKTGALGVLLRSLPVPAVVETFIAGMFFTSVFTTAPAVVALGEIGRVTPLFQTALVGGVGALCGDLILFRFFRDNVSDDLHFLYTIVRKKGRHSDLVGRLKKIKLMRFLIPLLGGLIIASPFPDELGLMILGLSKLELKKMIPLSLTFNIIGILLIGIVARQI